MKIKRMILAFLAATVLTLSLSARAQEKPAPAPAPDTLTNAAPLLKDLMTSNNIVTNTVGIVLLKISPSLWAGKYEVTQEAYQKLTRGNPSAFQGSQNPVDSVSWNDAVGFCGKLTTEEAKELPNGWSYTLPTEAQWLMLSAGAADADAVTSLKGRKSGTAPVGSLGANSLGLYDTRGNVMEWVLDSHDASFRVLKGGAWDTFTEVNSRPEFQWKVGPDDKKSSFGFRVLLTGDAPN
jgi:formylglycine-generating enzyme required for sulfatase activity